jgi:YD repeat-containing protein
MSYAGEELETVTDDLGRSLTFTHTDGRISQIQDFSGRTFQYDYDDDGNLISYKNPLAVSALGKQAPVTYEYYSGEIEGGYGGYDGGKNIDHAMKRYRLPRGNGMAFEYYANGRVFRHTDSLGGVTSFTYNDFRRETVQVNERGFERRFFFDKNGMPVKIIEENGAEHEYTYDPAAPFNRLTQTDPLGYRTSYAYDGNGNVTTISSPRGTTETYSESKPAPMRWVR